MLHVLILEGRLVLGWGRALEIQKSGWVGGLGFKVCGERALDLGVKLLSRSVQGEEKETLLSEEIGGNRDQNPRVGLGRIFLNQKGTGAGTGTGKQKGLFVLLRADLGHFLLGKGTWVERLAVFGIANKDEYDFE